MLLLLLLSVCSYVNADVYMQNARGSNNRLDEQGRERANANRMFDSQNNNRGGYNVGSLYYFAGSELNVEWTNQHECGQSNNHCELILQYMCSETLRDGTKTQTIPEKKSQCRNYNCNTDLEFGMNEDYNYYVNCKNRQRNLGLFTADQNLKGDTAKYTRQNPGGTRRGYECPEERDYYPYWGPSPWKDIAIMTNDISMCDYYKSESQNVQSKFYCKMPSSYERELKKITIPRNLPNIPITQSNCEKFEYPKDSNRTGVWTEVKPWGIPPPDCISAPKSRDNHLGNTIGGFPSMYNWTLLNDTNEHCAMRLRYNISTNDYAPWNTTAAQNKAGKNGASKVNIGALVGLAEDEAIERGYVLKNNPVVEPFNIAGGIGAKFQLRLAINTAQYGRTFQDRSHSIAIREPPADAKGQRIYNLNVRGKRGNIVQVYPAVEYDFTPNRMLLSMEDYIHIQWTGSNTNPQNNDGQGLRGTDRNNIAVTTKQIYPEGTPGAAVAEGKKFGHWGNNYPAHLNAVNFLGLSKADLKTLVLTSPGQFRGELSELDDAGTYFDLGPRKVTSAGTCHYMCTRNNNFSNRSQKGKIIVNATPMKTKQVGPTGGVIDFDGGEQGVWIQSGAFDEPTDVTLEQWPKEAGDQVIKAKGYINVGDDYGSDYVVVHPFERVAKSMTIKMKLTSKDADVYASLDYKNWQKQDCSIEGDIAVCETMQGGIYVARTDDSSVTATVVGVVVALVIIAIIVGAVWYYCKKQPDSMTTVRTRFQELKRSTQNVI